MLFYIVTALLCIAEGTRANHPGRILLAGIFLGGAACNGSAAILAIVALVISLLIAGQDANVLKKFPSWSIYTGCFLFILFAAPWLITNILWFGNPFFPYCSWIFPPGGMYRDVVTECAIDTGWFYQQKTAIFYFNENELWPQFLKLWPTWIGIPSGIWFWRSSPFARLSIIWTVIIWIFWMTIGKGVMHLPFILYLIPVNIIVLAHLIGKVYSLPPGTERGRFFRIIFWMLLIGGIGIGGARNAKFNPPLTSDQIVDTLRRFHGSYDLVTAANNIIPENLSALGILCEDGRIFADFRLIGGGNAGWGNHQTIVNNCSTPEELADFMLEHYNANYLIVDGARLNRQQSEMYQKIKDLVRSGDFPDYFREVGRVGQGGIYIIR
jgi:hypothetical protein